MQDSNEDAIKDTELSKVNG